MYAMACLGAVADMLVQQVKVEAPELLLDAVEYVRAGGDSGGILVVHRHANVAVSGECVATVASSAELNGKALGDPFCIGPTQPGCAAWIWESHPLHFNGPDGVGDHAGGRVELHDLLVWGMVWTVAYPADMHSVGRHGSHCGG